MSNFNQNPFQTNSGIGGMAANQGRKWDYRDVNAPAMAPGKTANAFIILHATAICEFLNS